MGTTRSVRMSQDLEKVSEIFKSIDNSINDHSIKDLFRLGKFDSGRSRPRSILVKFVRCADASKVLSKVSSLSQPFIVKPDMSAAQRVRESILLKERWSLLQSGTNRKSIKIRNSSIYVNNILHGTVDSSNTFQCEHEHLTDSNVSTPTSCPNTPSHESAFVDPDPDVSATLMDSGQLPT